ncbi:MAG TPA: hypothetical protein VGN80_19040 [Devosiaceae bacterium]|jgi:hypothetical protein|nr:hypothetical protein [Devosiaceae bacterium]
MPNVAVDQSKLVTAEDKAAMLRDGAKASIVAAIDAATTALLAPYPRAERMSFDAKAAEAQAALATDPEAMELATVPLLTVECAAEHGGANTSTRRGQVVAKAIAVNAKAAAWGALAAGFSGVRQRAFAALDAAEGRDDVQAALDTALAEVERMAEGQSGAAYSSEATTIGCAGRSAVTM